MAAMDSATAAGDSARVAEDPPVARRKTGHLFARRTRTRGTAAAALKETTLRSTVRLSTGLPVTASILLLFDVFYLKDMNPSLKTEQNTNETFMSLNESSS